MLDLVPSLREHELAVELANFLSEDAVFWLRRSWVPPGSEPISIAVQILDPIAPEGQAVADCLRGLLATPYRASRPNDYQPAPTVWPPASIIATAFAFEAHATVRLSTQAKDSGLWLTFEISTRSKPDPVGSYSIALD